MHFRWSWMPVFPAIGEIFCVKRREGIIRMAGLGAIGLQIHHVHSMRQTVVF